MATNEPTSNNRLKNPYRHFILEHYHTIRISSKAEKNSVAVF